MVKSATSINNFLRKLGPTLVGLAEVRVCVDINTTWPEPHEIASLMLYMHMHSSWEHTKIVNTTDGKLPTCLAFA